MNFSTIIKIFPYPAESSHFATKNKFSFGFCVRTLFLWILRSSSWANTQVTLVTKFDLDPHVEFQYPPSISSGNIAMHALVNHRTVWSVCFIDNTGTHELRCVTMMKSVQFEIRNWVFKSRDFWDLSVEQSVFTCGSG